MLFTKFGLERAAEVGPFDQSDAFVNAQASTLHEMKDVYSTWKEDHNYGNQSTNMGDFLDFYDQNQAPGGRIYASFLGRVAMELKELLGDQDAVRELQVRTYQPELDTRYQFPTAQQLHRDNFVEGAEIGIRYLTANRYPTVIPELIKTQPGTIYRTSNKYTLHKRPKYPRSAEEPRALLVINV